MHPSKTMKYEMGQASKFPKHELIQPGALAKGLGQSLKSMSTIRVNAERRTPIAKNRSPFESRKAKKVVGVAQGSKGNQNSLLKSKKAKKVIEVAEDATRNETSPCEYDRITKVRGTNICKKVLRLRPGEKLKVAFYQNRVVGSNHTLGLLVRDRNMCPLRVHSWMDIEEHKLEHMWAAITAEIQELVQSEPSLTNIEVVERCFRPQCKSHAVGFGGGITTKELKGGSTSKAALLEELKTTRKEKESLQKRIDILESKYDRLESIVVRQHPSPSSPPPG
uniref:TNP2-like transposon protein n=1 Tax=Solanum tuberosum TaxID=4113 RepID=M0ZVD1_SOLTU